MEKLHSLLTGELHKIRNALVRQSDSQAREKRVRDFMLIRIQMVLETQKISIRLIDQHLSLDLEYLSSLVRVRLRALRGEVQPELILARLVRKELSNSDLSF